MTKKQTSNIKVLAEKKCRICSEVKQFTEFPKDPHGAFGYRSECRPCRSILRSKHDYIRERFRKHGVRNKGTIHYTDDLILRLHTATKCQFCGDEFVNESGHKKQATIDHIYANKVNADFNAAIVCRGCNSTKRDSHIYDFYESSERFSVELWSAFIKDWIGRMINREITDEEVVIMTGHLRDESSEYKLWRAKESTVKAIG